MDNTDSIERAGKSAGIFRWLDVLFLALLGAYVCLGMTRVPFHGDESTFIRMSMDFVYIFQEGALQKVVYNPEPGFRSVEQDLRESIGAIDPLSIGLAWNAAGLLPSEINGFWYWYPQSEENEWAYNVEQGNMPGARLLDTARLPSTLFTAAAIAVVFLVAFALSRSRTAAWLAALLYATTPSILVNGRRAMQEGAMLFFTALVVLCALYIVRTMRAGKARGGMLLVGYGLLGVAAGLALASKHTSILIVLPAYLIIIILGWRLGSEKDPQDRKAAYFRLLIGLTGSGLLALSFFYFLTPVWWFYRLHWLILLCLAAACLLFAIPMQGWWKWVLRILPVAAILLTTMAEPSAWEGIYQPIPIIIQSRDELLQTQQAQGRVLPTLQSRIREMAVQLLSAKTQYYESYYWEGLPELDAQIRAYEAAHLNGRGGGIAWGIIVFMLIAGGVYAALFHRRGWETLFLFVWAAVPTGILLLANPLAWQRYYIILIAPWSVLAGFAVVPLASETMFKNIRRLSARISTPSSTIEN
jgi:hypothetical protein